MEDRLPLACTIPQAVRLSGIGRSSLYKAIARGELSARKAGNRTIVLTEDLHRWLEGLPTIGDKKVPSTLLKTPAVSK